MSHEKDRSSLPPGNDPPGKDPPKMEPSPEPSPRDVIQEGSPDNPPQISPIGQDPSPIHDLQLDGTDDSKISEEGTPDKASNEHLPRIEDIPADLKVESDTSEKLAIEAIVDAMLMIITTEKFYYGSVALEDLKEILLLEGDFVLRTGEPISPTAKPPAEVVAKGKKGLAVVAFKFINIGLATRTVTLNGHMGKNSIIELLSDHVRLGQPIDAEDTRLRRAINRPVWQLNKENILIGEEIGHGAFGTVSKGQLKEAKGLRQVAIKQIRVCDENKIKMEEMLLEARLMRQLQHPNVVIFYGMLNNGVEAMIVMELVNGGSLDHFLKNNKGKISISEKMSYCFDVSYGLHYLHQRGMMHRDLAVRNCLIDVQQRIVKISDFGMSKQGNIYHIQANERTPIRWQAPEVIRTATYTRECDIWSLGMIFFEIFADATPPFDGIDNKVIISRLHDPKFRPNVPQATPPLMLMILLSLWDADPKKRLPTKQITQQLYKYSNRKGGRKLPKKSVSKSPSVCLKKASSVLIRKSQACSVLPGGGGRKPKKAGSNKPSGIVGRGSSIIAKEVGKKNSNTRKKESKKRNVRMKKNKDKKHH